MMIIIVYHGIYMMIQGTSQTTDALVSQITGNNRVIYNNMRKM